MTQFTLVNHDNERTYIEESRSDAETRKQNGINEFGFDEEDLDIVKGAFAEYDDVEQPTATDGGSAAVVDAPPEPEVVDESVTEQLPNDGPSVNEDPISWMPSKFTERVDGTVTITRKGYEVLAHHYEIQGGTEMVVSPLETDMEYVVHKATAIDADGDEYTAYGEAHATDNGVENIVRMSDTRAYKRAVSRATGVGMVAVEELQDEL